VAIRISGLDHIVLRVVDVDAALHFYCDILGCREERRLDAFGLIQLRAGRHLIDLVDVAKPIGLAGGPPPGDDARNVDHFALLLEDFDEAEIRHHLEAHGIEVGEVAERYGAEGMGPSIYVEDPMGNVVELKGRG